MKKLLLIQLSLVICLFGCSLLSPCFSQTRDSLLTIYNNQTIRTAGNSFIKGGETYSFRQLKKEFTSSFTMPLYKKAKSDRRLGGLLTVGAIGSLVGSIIVRKNNPTIAGVLSGVAIAFNFGAVRLNKRSSEMLDQAIWHRNKEILFNTSQ